MLMNLLQHVLDGQLFRHERIITWNSHDEQQVAGTWYYTCVLKELDFIYQHHSRATRE